MNQYFGIQILGVLVGILGVMVGVIGVGMLYLLHFVFGMAYLVFVFCPQGPRMTAYIEPRTTAQKDLEWRRTVQNMRFDRKKQIVGLSL